MLGPISVSRLNSVGATSGRTLAPAWKPQMLLRGESLYPSPATLTPLAHPETRIDELSAEERAVYATLKPERLPQHVAIIMDGNGRWAGLRSLKRFLGHQQGAKTVQYVTETAARIGLPWLTLYAFSLENNLRRPRAEVSFLMRLLKSYLDDNIERMMKNNIRMRSIGRIHDLPEDVQEHLRAAEDATARNTGTTLTLALNYGARSELLDAFRNLADEVKNKHLNPALITEEDIHRHLYTAHMPDPDLLIRTSGELRISNFLLWQIAYTEIFITERYWPDFRGVHLLEAIAAFQCRERRYGGIGEAGGEVEQDPERIDIAVS